VTVAQGEVYACSLPYRKYVLVICFAVTRSAAVPEIPSLLLLPDNEMETLARNVKRFTLGAKIEREALRFRSFVLAKPVPNGRTSFLYGSEHA
jgi:hypothetical protein